MTATDPTNAIPNQQIGSNAAYNSIYNAMAEIQAQNSEFAENINRAAQGTTTDIALPGVMEKDAKGNSTGKELKVDMSTAAGAMAVSIYLEGQSNKVQTASQVAAEGKKEVKTVNQTVG